jgi:hypothetical protein
MVVKVVGDDQNIKKPFRFFDIWMDHDEFMPLVMKVWDQNLEGRLMYQLCCKLKKLKEEFELFNRDHFSNISNRFKDAKDNVQGSTCFVNSTWRFDFVHVKGNCT